MSVKFGRCTLLSATLRGVEAHIVTVEVMVSSGLPGMTVVGMPDAAVQEARERVRSAVNSAGFSMPSVKIVVNLAPADMRKAGSGFDLPIALGILSATAQIDPSLIEGRLFVGELSLDGRIRGVSGMLAFGLCAHANGLGLVSSPDAPEVPIGTLRHERLEHLGALHPGGKGLVEPAGTPASDGAAFISAPDFADIAGHDMAKRALQIAAAGSHGVLLMGPPGSGKTMLASRLPGILPDLSDKEMLQTAIIHSVAGEDVATLMGRIRPFRHPHHSATKAGLIGGGTPVRPGEISLAHNGVLFLDEIAEFSSSVLQCMRQPMESHAVNITRADGSVSMPAKFMLVAASNPCPCGYFGDPEHSCSCRENDIAKYQSRIGGPLIDRIDMHLDIERLPPDSVLETGKGTSSAQLREGVLKAREFASWRAARKGGDVDGVSGAQIPCVSAAGVEATGVASPADIVESCAMTDAARSFILTVAQANALSGRSILRTLGIARTIADMAERESVGEEHVAEALGYRLRDGIGK